MSADARSRTRPPASAQRRIAVVGALMCAALLGLWAKSARLQLVLGEDLRGLAQDQYVRTSRIDAPRGDIVDREGRPLAVSVPAWSIAARPALVVDVAGAASAISAALELPAVDVRARLEGKSKYVWLARRVSREHADSVRALGIAGLEIRKDARRYYPAKTLAGQLFGAVDVDGVARSGVERAYDKELAGRPDKTPTLLDNKGDRIALDSDVDVVAHEGDSVALTIDLELQRVAEEALAATVAEHGARAAWAVMLDARTAEVLALANVPAFNPNASGGDVALARNRALSEAFEPGSILKMTTFAAALDAGVVTPTESIYCENGRMQLGKHVIHDTHKAEWLTVTEVFQQSSNIGTLKIAQRLGEERFRAALVRYGFGARPGTGLVEEAAGRLPREARWGDARLATVSFGHGVLVSAMQMASFAQAVANGGVRVSPQLLRSIHTSTGEIVRTAQGVDGERIFSEATARVLTEVMSSVTRAGGTGTLAAIPGIDVAGKTGTAEKVDPITKRYSDTLHLSSFVGFAPAHAPEVVAIVVVDEPKGPAFGGTVAAPAWRAMVERALVARGALRGGSLATAAPPPPPAPEPHHVDTVDSAQTEQNADALVPNLAGLTARAAVRRAEQVGALTQLSGSGLVVEQQPAPGMQLKAGEPIVVVLASGVMP